MNGGTAAVSSTRPSVLVVDDEREVLHAIQDTLEGDYQVYAEASPVAAIELLKLPAGEGARARTRTACADRAHCGLLSRERNSTRLGETQQARGLAA